MFFEKSLCIIFQEFFQLLYRSWKSLSDHIIWCSCYRWNLLISLFFNEFKINNILADIVKPLHCFFYLLKFERAFQKLGDIDIIYKCIFEWFSFFILLQIREWRIRVLFEEIFDGVFEYSPEVSREWLIFFVCFYSFPKFYIEIWNDIFCILLCYRVICVDITKKHINSLEVELVECVLILLLQFFYMFCINIDHYSYIMI